LLRLLDLFSFYIDSWIYFPVIKGIYIHICIIEGSRTNGSARKQVHLLSTALSDITNTGSPESPSGVMGINFATM